MISLWKKVIELGKRNIFLIALAAIIFGCTSIHDKVVVTPVAGVENIPTEIAIYPLLTSEQVLVIAHPYKRVRLFSASTRVSDDRLYIVAPAETKLVSNIYSQLLTSRLSANLSRNGFTLKELPVEAPSEYYEKEENSFFVSLETLRHLREDYGLKAVLIGNVYFIANERDRSIIDVRAAYLRLVDTGTLDVLCHISIDEIYQGESIRNTAESLAFALAKEAGLVPGETK